jgi:3-hydroxyisobutyrate dehydrogenase-like beta-hydroxyacid dehydrogenase
VDRLGSHGLPDGGAYPQEGRARPHRLQPQRAQSRSLGKEYGGKTAPTPAEAAKDQDFVFCCVGNDNDLREVTLGPKGAFSSVRKGAVFVDNTTASANIARELYAAARPRASTSSMPPCRAARPAPSTAR